MRRRKDVSVLVVGGLHRDDLNGPVASVKMQDICWCVSSWALTVTIGKQFT